MKKYLIFVAITIAIITQQNVIAQIRGQRFQNRPGLGTRVQQLRDQLQQNDGGDSRDRPVLDALRGPALEALKNIMNSQTPRSSQLKPMYGVSLQNFGELDEALTDFAENADSSEYYSNFKDTAQNWGKNILDPNRSSGFVVLTDGVGTYPMLFVPLVPEDDDAAYDFLATFGKEGDQPDQVPIHEEGDYRWVPLGENPYIEFPPSYIVVQKGDWGYFIPQTLIRAIPDDPQNYTPQKSMQASMLPQSSGRYLVSDYIYLDGLPRTLGNGLLKIGEIIVMVSNPNKAKFGDEQKEMLFGLIDFGSLLLNETQMIYRGIRIDDVVGDLVYETTLYVVPGGRLSNSFQRQLNRTTPLTEYYQPDGATFAIIFAEDVDPAMQRTAHAMMRHIGRKMEEQMLVEQRLRDEDREAEIKAREQAKAESDRLRAEEREREIAAQNDPNRKAKPKTTQGLANAFSSAAGEYFGGVWDKSLAATIDGTKDKLEIDSVRKLEGILHENVNRGIMNFALTVKSGGTTIGAMEIIGGDRIAAILSGAQLKINTEARSAHLRDKVFLNYFKFEGYNLSRIVYPISEIKGTESYPTALQEKTLHFHFAIRENRFCFAVGLEPSVLDDLKNAISADSGEQPIPETVFIFSGYEFGRILEPYADQMQNESMPELVQTLINAGHDAIVTYQVAYDATTYYSVMRIPKSLWPIIGQVLKSGRNGKSPLLSLPRFL